MLQLMALMKYADGKATTGKSRDEYCIAWLADGNSFVVRNPEEFTREVLPRFFKKTKFTSFVRKLYRWGFKQVNRGIGPDDPIIFGNEYFQRDNLELMTKMRSVTATTPKHQQQQQQHHQLQGLGHGQPLQQDDIMYFATAQKRSFEESFGHQQQQQQQLLLLQQQQQQQQHYLERDPKRILLEQLMQQQQQQNAMSSLHSLKGPQSLYSAAAAAAAAAAQQPQLSLLTRSFQQGLGAGTTATNIGGGAMTTNCLSNQLQGFTTANTSRAALMGNFNTAAAVAAQANNATTTTNLGNWFASNINSPFGGGGTAAAAGTSGPGRSSTVDIVDAAINALRNAH